MTTAPLHTRVSESANLCQSNTPPRPLATFLNTFKAGLRAWRRRARSRRQLTQLDCRALHDIGVSCLQARDEWQKPFWRP